MASAVSFILAGAGLLTMYLAPRKPMVAWCFALTVQPLWIWWSFTQQQYGFLLTTAVYILIYVSNVRATMQQRAACDQARTVPDERNE